MFKKFNRFEKRVLAIAVIGLVVNTVVIIATSNK